MRVAIYARVSKDEDETFASVESQRKHCADLAKRNGWTVVDTFTDNDLSASKYARKARPQYEQLLHRVAAGAYDAVLMWEASRLTREMGAYAAMRDVFAKSGTKLCSSGRLIDFDDPDDTFASGLGLLLAEQESARTSKRVRRALGDRAAAGRPHGRTPWGYARDYNVTPFRQYPREPEASWLREAADRILAGESAYSVASDFERRGIKIGADNPTKATKAHSILKLLKKPAYGGYREHHGTLYPGDWEPVIDPGKWRRLQVIFRNPERRKAGSNPGQKVKYLLSGISECSVCGSKLRRLPSHNGNDVYSCPNRCIGRNREALDAYITELFLAWLSRPGTAQAVAEQRAATERSMAADAETVQAEIAALEARLDSFVVQAVDGSISPATLARVEVELTGKIEAQKAKLEGLLPAPMHVQDPALLAKTWPHLPLEEQRMHIKAVMRIIVHPVLVRGNKGFDPSRIEIVWR